jgi:hypothetical protein
MLRTGWRLQRIALWGSIGLVTAALGSSMTTMTGCAAAVATGAGAAGAIYLTSRGAKAEVKGTPDAVEPAARAAMSEKNIVITGEKSEKSGAHRELEGKVGELDVKVTLDATDSGTTTVEASAQENLVAWNKDFAKDLVSRIVSKT